MLHQRALLACLVFLCLAPCSAASDETAGRSSTNASSAVLGVGKSSQVGSRGRSQRQVYKSRLTPHWLEDGTRFWYRNDLSQGQREYILVDAAAGRRERAFDHERLAEALRDAAVTNFTATQLDLDLLTVEPDSSAITFRAKGTAWHCALDTYELKPIETDDIPRGGNQSAIHPDDAPRASRRTGPETELRFVNQTPDTIELFWLDTSGARRSYGTLAAGQARSQHTFAGHVWLAVDAGDNTIVAFEAKATPGDAVISTDNPPQRQERRRSRRSTSRSGGTSPDGRWLALVRDGNLFVRDLHTEGNPEQQLTKDGTDDIPYGRADWSPNSRSLVACKTEPGERKDVYLVESSPRGGGRAVLHQRPYALPGDKFTTYEVALFGHGSAPGNDNSAANPDTWERIETDLDVIDFGRPRLRWTSDGNKFRVTKTDRGHQRLRVIEVDSATGRSRNILDEQTSTFIWTAHTENLGTPLVTWLKDTDELIYISEVDGWRHLYLIDASQPDADETAVSEPQVSVKGRSLFAPGLKNQITKGDWIVKGVERIDEANRQIWFRAGGINPDQDPYLVHYCRVNFDGTGFVQLTAGDGNHSVQYSPDRRYLIDTYSRIDAPPIHELRRVDDGKLVCELEQADISELTAAGWQAPEVFVAEGRDGKTDIWGIICRPPNFDPEKHYPVIEDIYAGPQGSFVPKSFSSGQRYASLLRRGFIVVKIDGMGTANRSKAFHEVCWHNLKDGGFPDRILWMKAAAARYSEMDLSRVGIYGGSAGGQNAAAAVLFHPDFYKVAVAGCGCHDNRMDKASWNEQWMGYPVGPQYSASSNIDNAHRLEGELMLIVGEMDTNVPPESTLRLADALIKADKDFDLIVVPGAGHGMGGRYGQRRMHDFFVQHLIEDKPLTDEGEDSKAPGPQAAASVAQPVEIFPADETPPVVSPPNSFFDLVRKRDRVAARHFYGKYIDVQGMPVVASDEVADEALQRTYSIVTHMLAGRPDIIEALVDSGMYLIIIGKNQVYTDMPENRNARNADYLNERVRGTGGLPTSFGEENLLGWPLDRYDDESIAVHEFCHTIDRALRTADPAWRERRDTVYRNAMDKGLYRNEYAASNPGEYWAEIAQAYFDCQRVNNWNHGPIGTREQLKIYDPEGYELVRSTFRLSPEQDWRYQPPQTLPNVVPPPASLGIDPYYTKFTWAREFTVLGRDASDEALLAANNTIRKMFAYRHDILKVPIADGVRLVVLGRDESLADLPELSGLATDADTDLLGRSLHYSPETRLLVVAEECVLADPQDALVGHDPVICAFAQALYEVCGKRPVDPDWDDRPERSRQQYELRVQRLDVRFDETLAEAYDAAMESDKSRGTSAAHDRVAYWTAGVLAFFDAAGQDAAPPDAPHPIATREVLREYDPKLFAIVQQTMAYEGHVDWRRENLTRTPATR